MCPIPDKYQPEQKAGSCEVITQFIFEPGARPFDDANPIVKARFANAGEKYKGAR